MERTEVEERAWLISLAEFALSLARFATALALASLTLAKAWERSRVASVGKSAPKRSRTRRKI